MNETNLADLFAEEPEDGTRLVRWIDGQSEVIWRDDATAATWAAQPGERWFSDTRSDPMTFRNILAEATQVHAVVPLAQSGLALTDAQV